MAYIHGAEKQIHCLIFTQMFENNAILPLVFQAKINDVSIVSAGFQFCQSPGDEVDKENPTLKY